MKRIISFLIFFILALCVVYAAADTLQLPEGLKRIEEEAFYGDTSLDEVVLREGVEFIGSKAFAESTLKRIYLPLSLKEIAEDAFDPGVEKINGERVTLKIAHIGPTTGANAFYGYATSRGAKIAADEINAAEGKYQIEMIYADDKHDTEVAINAYNTVLDQGAQMILGTTTTTPCIAVAAEAFNDRVFMLTPSASSPEVTKNNDNVFQVCFTDPAQGAASAEFISNHKLATKVAVIYNNADAYSDGIFQTFEAKAKELGLEIVSTTTFYDNTTDFTAQIADAQNNGAELVFLPMYYTSACQILITADAIGYKPIFFGVDGMEGLLSMEGFDTSLAEGVMILMPFSADAKDEKTRNFVAKYQSLYNEVPNQFAADAYDGIYALVAAARRANVQNGSAPEDICDFMIKAMQEITINGLTGSMSWSSSGKVSKTPKAIIIKNGTYISFSD